MSKLMRVVSPSCQKDTIVQLLGAWMRRFDLKANKDTLEALVMVSANHHTYNPIRAYLEGLQCDGTESLSSSL